MEEMKARRRKQASFKDGAYAIKKYLNQAMEAEPIGDAREFFTVDIACTLHPDGELTDRNVFGIELRA